MNKKMMKGFTLVEIMIVVAIIAILAAIAIPNFIAYRNESQENACVSNMSSIKTAAESYLTKHPDATTFTATELAPADGKGFLKKMPTCPKNGKSYSVTKDTSGAIVVSCEDHPDAAAGGEGDGEGS